MRNVIDPILNIYFEFHEYFDSDYSGTTTNLMSISQAVDVFTNATIWLRTNHLKGFLREFAVANVTITNGMGGGMV